MTQKDLKRLTRSDLMEMLLEVSKENEQLRKELAGVRQELEQRELRIQEAGSLAEAALKLTEVFEQAQAACDLYTQEIHRRCSRMESATQSRCKRILSKVSDNPNDPAMVDRLNELWRNTAIE